jgi:hypothetical protein
LTSRIVAKLSLARRSIGLVFLIERRVPLGYKLQEGNLGLRLRLGRHNMRGREDC